MKIEHAVQTDCESCVDFIWGGVLGKRYYRTKELLSQKVKQGIENDCFFVTRDDEGQLLGILWYQLEGAFNTYPYLHMIAVKEDEYSRADYTTSPVIGNRWLCNLFLLTEVWQI